MAEIGEPIRRIKVIPLNEPIEAPEGPLRKEPIKEPPVKTPEKVPA